LHHWCRLSPVEVVVRVLNLHRLAPGAESYYLDQVVSGVEDYYAEAGEAPGYWLASSNLLGLDGVVDGDDLRAVLTGHHPETDERLHRARNRKVPAWDLTFRAPKSVSILWGLGEPAVTREVAAAHDAAVARAVAYMEEVAAFTRTGRNGIHRVKADGFIAAGFRHRTSRDRDPLLHTHVLVANSVRAADGRWRTIDATALYDHARTAGYLYQAHLRNELTERLGMAWTPIHDGLADVAGIDEELIDLFSKRREQVELTMAEWGLTSAKAAQVSTLQTRAAKAVSPERTTDQQARWRSEALTIGVDTADLGLVMADHQVPSIDADETIALFNRLSSSSGLTETHSTFDRRDVLRRLIDELPAAVPVDVIESLASQYLQRPEVEAVGWEERTGTSFSTIELMDLELDLVALVHTGWGAGRAVASPSSLASAFDARPSISPEQAHVVTEMCSSGRSVDVLVAAAGTGKTFSLDAAREAWQRSSYRVIGCALAASAAHELEAGSGIPSSTIAKLTLELERDRQWMDRRTVLVIDEAGMVGTRAFAPLLQTAVVRGAKVVLVGDPRQLPEIRTGGVLASLARRHPILTLTENRRQQDIVEREALGQLRSGDVVRAMRSLRDHGDVVTAPNTEAVRNGMVGDWFRHRNDGRTSLMMAGRNADVDDLNRRARRFVAAAGELSGESMMVAGRPFQVGDQVVCTRNDHPNGVRNGTGGQITAIDHRTRTVTIATEEGDRTLGRDYLAAGWMRHGYAVTVHKAQGRTCDHGLLLASDDLHREMGYVGLSRGRESNRMYVVSTEPADELERHGRHEERDDLYDLVVESLHKSAAKELAIDRADPDLGADDDLDLGW
jgi:conjugative relaxase-like TrwC/TraI family protein